MTTLNDVRERIRTQLESAAGLIEPLIVTPTDLRLAGFRRRVKSRLQDLEGESWDNDAIDEAIRTALGQFSKYNPFKDIATIDLTEAGREIDVSGISGLLRVEKVWWDYDDSDPAYPPNFRQFEVWPDGTLFVDDREEPQSGDTVRVWYTKRHTIDGLDGGTETTIPANDEGTIVTGACHFAAQARSAALAEELTAHDDVAANLRKYADEQGTNFRFQAQMDLRQYVIRAQAYAQEDIDEAIRWAIHRMSEVYPHEAITTVTLTEDGREVDISGVQYNRIVKVWVDYDASDPRYPPLWAKFEVWPGDVLYIDEGDEPDSGEVIRIFYITDHTIENLDGATETTLKDAQINTIVVGASGYCAEERVQEKDVYWGNRQLRDWGERRLKEFERALERLRRKNLRTASVAQPAGTYEGDPWA